MSFSEYRVSFIVVTGILVLLVASPALSRLLVLPRTEFFTELWLLGPNRKAEGYPFNVTSGGEYQIFLGIGNRLGYAAYYRVEVKLRNQTQSAPDSFNRTSSSLPSLYAVQAFVADESSWEFPVTFSLNYGYNRLLRQITVNDMILNDSMLPVENLIANLDSKNNGFFANLFFELWIYNNTRASFQYHERFVGIWLNMTVS